MLPKPQRLKTPAACACLQIFRFSVWEGRPLPGMSLMNLRYRNEAAVQMPRRTGSSFPSSSAASPTPLCIAGGHSGVEGPGLSAAQRSLYCLGAVMLRYAWSRLTHHAATRHWGDESGAAWQQRGWALMRRAESSYRLASLLNFLAFLRSGRYRWAALHLLHKQCRACSSAAASGVCHLMWHRFEAPFCLICPSVLRRSLLERLLRARLVYQQPVAARAISFEYLNRQLVWSELRCVRLGMREGRRWEGGKGGERRAGGEEIGGNKTWQNALKVLQQHMEES